MLYQTQRDQFHFLQPSAQISKHENRLIWFLIQFKTTKLGHFYLKVRESQISGWSGSELVSFALSALFSSSKVGFESPKLL